MTYKYSKSNKPDPLQPSCRKKIYNTPEEAREMIDFINENRVVRHIHAYKCSVCGFWHLTSKPEKKFP